jgi:hypothetical protein
MQRMVQFVSDEEGEPKMNILSARMHFIDNS